MKCKSCGAPLEIVAGEAQKACSYCGTINARNDVVRVINAFFNGSGVDARAAVSEGKKRSMKLGIMVVFFFLLSVLISVFVMLSTFKSLAR